VISIHPSSKISPLADIEDSMRGTKIIIGAGSMVDSFVKIKPVGGMGDLVIGMYSYINSGCVLYTGNGIQIGDHVAIASNCTLAPVNHAYIDKSLPIIKQGFLPSKGGIKILNDVWIGANVVILDGSFLPKGVVVGAGSVVKGQLEEYGIYSGNPLVLKGFRK
jgi:acetyltransferase-like isoleucine patch superfamily enzyme